MEPTKFRKHKLDCDTCGSPLDLQAGGLATCAFCKSKYFLEGLKPARQPEPFVTATYYESTGITHPYWVDGGVSSRHHSPMKDWLEVLDG